MRRFISAPQIVASPSSSTDQIMQTAVAHHQAGRLAPADAIYRQVLSREPNNADALHLLGLIAHQCGNDNDAIALIGRAVALRPKTAEFHVNLGAALRRMGRLTD